MQCHAKLAHMIGLTHAIVFQQMKWLIAGAPESRSHTDDSGTLFAEYTQAWLIEKHFPFICDRQLRRVFDDLSEMGLMIIKSYRKDGKTYNQYAISSAHEYLLTSERYEDFLKIEEDNGGKTASSFFRESMKDNMSAGHYVKTLQSEAPDIMSNRAPDIMSDKEDINTKKIKEDKDGCVISDEFKEEWNKYSGLPKFIRLTTKRMQSLRSRMKDSFFSENWKQALQFMGTTPFYYGENDRGWRADVDYFLRPDTVIKLIERKNTQGKAGFKPSQQQQKPRLPDNLNPDLFR